MPSVAIRSPPGATNQIGDDGRRQGDADAEPSVPTSKVRLYKHPNCIIIARMQPTTRRRSVQFVDHHESMLRSESGGCSPMRLLLVGLGLVHSGTVCNEPGFENYRRGGDCVRPPLPVCTDPQAANYLPPGPGMPRRDTTRYTRAHPGAIALTCTYERFSQVGTLRSLSNYRRAAGTTCMHAMMTMPTTLCGHGS